MPIDLSGLNFIMPAFSFLFVFVLIYALLAKTKVLGENKFIHLFISFILSIFFIVNVSLVEFVKFSSAWFVVFIVCTFLILVMVAFTHGKVDVIMKPWVAWAILVALIIFFIISSSFTMNWTINWLALKGWFFTDWFGLILLLGIAAIVSWVLIKFK